MGQDLAEKNHRASQNSFNGDSSNSAVPETVIAIREHEIADSNGQSTGPELDKPGFEQRGDMSSSCVIDIKVNDFGSENQRVCRICHLTAKESGKNLTELMEIGCGCKGELGVAHLHCAEAWFRVRGNRLCEICGETAKNIRGVSDNGFMEEWNERSTTDNGSTTSDGSRRCLHGQPLCNFLMACLVVAFILPWFFRVNMF